MINIWVIAPVIESPDHGITEAGEQKNLDALGLGPDVKLTCRFLDHGPSSVENEIDDALAVPDLLIKALEAQKAGADGVIVNCMCDPGVKVLRSALDIPVIGPAETAFHLAATLGRRFSILDIGGDTKGMVTEQVEGLGLGHSFASVRGTNIPVVEINDDSCVTRQRLFSEGRNAVLDDGADVLVLGCTGFTGTAKAIAGDLQAEGINVPVIDPLPLAIRTLAALIAEGHGHSKRAYPSPKDKKRIRGYDLPDLYDVVDE